MTITIMIGDVRDQLRMLPDNHVHCVVTSPPYWGLRDYGVDGQIGLEASPAEFIATMVEVFEEIRRVLRPDGTAWINMGDSYATGTSSGRKQGQRGIGESTQSAQDAVARNGNPFDLAAKQLVMMPHRLAIALQDAGWWVRQDIVWHKPNPMPESIKDRCTKSHEYIFLLSKSERYYFDAKAIAEEAIYGITPSGVGFGHGYDEGSRDRGRIKKPAGWATSGSHASINWATKQEQGRGESKRNSFSRETKYSKGSHGQKPQARLDREDIRYEGKRNKRSVWTIPTKGYQEAHFATFPPALIEPCILAGCPVGGIVLDPFFGAGTTGLVADRFQRDCIGIELNPAYAEMARKRILADSSLLCEIKVVGQIFTNTMVSMDGASALDVSQSLAGE